ncbi:FHA domain-containing protein PS1 isoform X1 [Cucurbita pepo subsp. pepo]|uniref:FHA domain-containing protein PS1 isoform X1 n=1 Tax=Cucurbita pepo subsp. pepo TaxID=3664 RepID=UPI000C9D39FD|nr:FHA domain-containing protein PS1 isoform X1 [Cucurbita pepo subsp. pepo]
MAYREEEKIPVFTVLKNGAILKNLFLVNNVTDRENEETIVLGRHPDCNIMLTHPSISRFHLQIHLNPSSHKVFVVDLSSVHGTWVSGKRIEAGARVEMREGDTLSVGGSSRVYKLHWVPLRDAYDFECPKEKKEEELAIIEEKAVEDCEKEISLSDENKETVEDSVSDSIGPLYSDENWNMELIKEVSVAPLAGEVEGMVVSSVNECGKEETSLLSIPFGNELKSLEMSLQSPCLPLSADNLSFNVENIIMSSIFDSETESSSCNMFEWEEIKSNILPVVDVITTSENGYQQLDNEKESLQPPSMSPCKGNFSDIEDTDMIAFAGGKYESSSRNEFEQIEISNVAVVDDEKPQPFDIESRQVLAERNSSSNVGYGVEIQYLPPDQEVKSETATEKNEFMEEHELHPLEDNHSSISTEKCLQEVEMLSKSQAEIGEDYADERNEELYKVTECLLYCQAQYKNDSSMKTTSEVTPNLPTNQNVERCVEEKYNARLETFEPSKSVAEKDYEHKELSEPSFVPSATDCSKIAVKNEIRTLHENVDAASPTRSENVSAMGGSIWLRRGKPTGFPRVEIGVSRENRAGTSLMDEMSSEITGDETVTNTLLSDLGGEEEEEMFTPDKENFTPNTLLKKSLNKKATIESSGDSFRSSKSQTSIFKSRHNVKQEEELSEESDKENQTPRALQEQKLAKQISKNRKFGKEKLLIKRGGMERAPFQSLQSNLAEKKRPEATSARKSNIAVSTGAMKKKLTVEGKKRWTMVVDINSLLNKESMKSLQRLQGLQGTHLIVPRIVIRELDCLRRHGRLFRKTTEAASVLEWIEDCMVKTRWWIDVESWEEGRPAATPPATPQAPYTEESSESLLWRTSSKIQSIAAQRSLMEALSPTPEDHILDCALHARRRAVNHGQLVVLSDDVTLKIKAMAEGLICETAKEFRESLVNPFSERFLWADSSPRGLTWSCPDDVVLRERYDRCSSRSSKGSEGAKGLKLILLHNSHYGVSR